MKQRWVMPDGKAFRTQSKRRYVIAFKTDEGDWSTWSKSDDKATATAKWRAACRSNEFAHLLDQDTGDVLR